MDRILRPRGGPSLDPRRKVILPGAVVGGRPMADLSEAEPLIQRMLERLAADPRSGAWAVVERATGVPAGTVLLKPLPDGAGEIEIGWHLHPDSWGRGLATEAARQLLARGLALGLEEIWAVTDPKNQRSVRVCEMLGMRLLGTTHRWYDEPSLMFWIGAREDQHPTISPTVLRQVRHEHRPPPIAQIAGKGGHARHGARDTLSAALRTAASAKPKWLVKARILVPSNPTNQNCRTGVYRQREHRPHALARRHLSRPPHRELTDSRPQQFAAQVTARATKARRSSCWIDHGPDALRRWPQVVGDPCHRPQGWGFWRVVNRAGVYYATAYEDGDLRIVLYRSRDGVHWSSGPTDLWRLGDTSYAGVVALGGGRFLVSWYSSPLKGDPSWIRGFAGPTSIWAATIDLSRLPGITRPPRLRLH